MAKMFQNRIVDKPMEDLFPLPPTKYGDLCKETQQEILKELMLERLHPRTYIRPAQAKLHMGFTWAVTLAHDSTKNIIREAFSNIGTKLGMDNGKLTLKFFRKADALFQLKYGLVLALAIIDDISLLFAN